MKLEIPNAFGIGREAPANLILRDKKVFWDWKGPWQIMADFKASQDINVLSSARRAPTRGELPAENPLWWRLLHDARTFFETESKI